MTLFEEKISKVISQIIEDYSQFRSKDGHAALNLKIELEDIPGSQGGKLSQTHYYFKGVNILKANEKF